MLKKRDLQDCHVLYDLMVHPDVFPFVRQKADSYEEFLFITKQTIEAEEQGLIISRTILDDWGSPAGTISLFDIDNKAGFLGTWIGKPYHGMGLNTRAKDVFFTELFYELGVETVYMKIRKKNLRSNKAAEKLPYAVAANETRKALYEEINLGSIKFNLFEISKDLFTLYIMRQTNIDVLEGHIKEA
ncbi:GNAT family N-acetyltransferase [Evansella clarkii]|uniref:GNAT family N-acetyltransferase n=1 Tax=Evansella clarkii TaxID=79879 RepID=UPI00099861D1|nr:GNAT family protein [Evansella clarkii]